MAQKEDKSFLFFLTSSLFLLYGFLILLRRSLKVKIDGGKMKLGDRIVDLAMCGEGELSLNGMAMVS